jgi:Tol biopolymer transport system component
VAVAVVDPARRLAPAARLPTRQNCKRPVLSPDRRWVVFDGTPPGQRPLSQFDIQVMRCDGTGRRWSPDGERIVFTSQRLRLSHLFVMRADGRGERQLTRRNAEDYEPSWF